MSEKERLTILVDADELAKFKQVSESRGHTMSWYLRKTIKDVIGERGEAQAEKPKPKRKKYKQLELPK